MDQKYDGMGSVVGFDDFSQCIVIAQKAPAVSIR
jgi:hypothetical protein